MGKRSVSRSFTDEKCQTEIRTADVTHVMTTRVRLLRQSQNKRSIGGRNGVGVVPLLVVGLRLREEVSRLHKKERGETRTHLPVNEEERARKKGEVEEEKG
jgi:hypothetical protein